MKLTELIKKLEEIAKEHPDAEVMLNKFMYASIVQKLEYLEIEDCVLIS